MLARRIGELVVAPDQFERRAGPGLYAIAAGQPLAAESGVGEVLPDALDGAGQHALQAHGVGVADDGVVGFGGGDGCVHFFFFLLLCAGGATHLLLANMSLDELRARVALIDGKGPTAASGGGRPDTIGKTATPGVTSGRLEGLR